MTGLFGGCVIKLRGKTIHRLWTGQFIENRRIESFMNRCLQKSIDEKLRRLLSASSCEKLFVIFLFFPVKIFGGLTDLYNQMFFEMSKSIFE